MIVNSIKIDIINEIFQRTLINEMLIDDNSQISKDAFDYKVINVNKVDCISEDKRNNEGDIKSEV